ncbi:thioredoxin domain-containing protein [Candidatus Pacearchaeota archaeon]|nr:thioredoxin domain-containing protein [Candidatus Pacearchaeota archaeon]
MTEHKKEEKTISIKKDTLWKAGTFLFAALFVIVLVIAIRPSGQVVNDNSGTQLEGVTKYVQYADDLGLDTKDFEECVNSGKYSSNVSADLQYGSSIGISGTPGFFINGRILSGAQPFSVFQQIIEEELSGTATNEARIDVEIGDSPVKGDSNAPVTIVEFSDYECPYCGRHFAQTYPQLLSEYVDTGKVKMVFKDFPLNFHAKAQKAAEAARCAGEQGDYWGMHDALFTSGV